MERLHGTKMSDNVNDPMLERKCWPPDNIEDMEPQLGRVFGDWSVERLVKLDLGYPTCSPRAISKH